MEYEYEFSTELPEDVLKILLELGKELKFDPLSSIESEDYFCGLVSDDSGSKEELRESLSKTVQRDFQVMKERPRWIQEAEWQFHNGKPMIFVGQLDSFIHQDGLKREVSFYVFWDFESGTVKTITQCD